MREILEACAFFPWWTAEGYAQVLGISPRTARKWLRRYEEEGLVQKVSPRHLYNEVHFVYSLTPDGFRETGGGIGGRNYWKGLLCFEILHSVRKEVLELGKVLFLWPFTGGIHALFGTENFVGGIFWDSGFFPLSFTLFSVRRFHRLYPGIPIFISFTSHQRMVRAISSLRKSVSRFFYFRPPGGWWVDIWGFKFSPSFFRVKEKVPERLKPPPFPFNSRLRELVQKRLLFPEPSYIWTLLYILFYPYLTTSQLGTILNISKEEIFKRCGWLRKRGFVEESYERGYRHFLLTPSGIDFLSELLGVRKSFFLLRWGRKGEKGWRREAEHTREMYDFLCSLVQYFRKEGGDITWEVNRSFGGKVRPDVFGTFYLDGKTGRFFLEWVREVRKRRLREKLLNYREISRRWYDYGGGEVPVLLIISPEMEKVMPIVKEVMGGEAMEVLVSEPELLRKPHRFSWALWRDQDGRARRWPWA